MRTMAAVWLLALAGLVGWASGAENSRRDAEWESLSGRNPELLKGSQANDLRAIEGLILWLDAAEGLEAAADGHPQEVERRHSCRKTAISKEACRYLDLTFIGSTRSNEMGPILPMGAERGNLWRTP